MGGGMAYRMVQQEPEGIGGGIFQHMEGMPPNVPGVAVAVDDLQAYLDKAVSLGGTALMQPSEIPGGFGSLAIFKRHCRQPHVSLQVVGRIMLTRATNLLPVPVHPWHSAIGTT